MRRMLTTSTSKTRVHRLGRAALALAAAGLIITAGACSSGDDDANPAPLSTADRGADRPPPAPPTTRGRDDHIARRRRPKPRPPSRPAPPSRRPPRRQPDPARLALLQGILDAHHASRRVRRCPHRAARRRRCDHRGDGRHADHRPRQRARGSRHACGTSAASPRRWSRSSCSSSPTRAASISTPASRSTCPISPAPTQITPRQLLQHTSGLNEYDSQPAVLERHAAPVDAGRADRRRRSSGAGRRTRRAVPLLEHQLRHPRSDHRAGDRQRVERRGAGTHRASRWA